MQTERQFGDASQEASGGTLWYYRAMLEALRYPEDMGDVLDELEKVIEEIEKLSSNEGGARV